MLITVGGAQTNHGRLTAAVAARNQMKCAIICMDDYPGELSANLLLDRIFGARVILHKPDGTPLADVVKDTIKAYESGENGAILSPWAAQMKSAPSDIMNVPGSSKMILNPAM